MADEIASDDKEKSIYLIQIRFLDEQLERCQLKCDELEKQNKDLASLCSLLEKDKKDIAEYLKYLAAEEEKKVEELVEQLESQQRVVEHHREKLKLQHRPELQEQQERIDKLNSDSRMQVVHLEEKKEQMEELLQLIQQMPDMESLEEQLDNQREAHEAALHSLRVEASRERERLIAERQNALDICVEIKIPEMLLEERAQHHEHMEKVQVLLNENMELWDEKEELKVEHTATCWEIDKLKENLNKVALEMHNHKTETEELTKRSQQLEAKVKEWRFTHRIMLAEEEALRQHVASVAEDCDQKTAEVAQLEAEIQEERSRRGQLEDDMQEATVILRHILMDSEETPETQRKMQRLVEILESTAPQGAGPAPSDPTEESSQGQKPQTSSPKPARAEALSLATDPLFLMARYRPGDLGFVPRPTWKRRPGASARAAPPSSSGNSAVRRRPALWTRPQRPDSEAGASTCTDH
ncbi:cilia- and flagella-associated protein 157-like [Trachinotus anak]|uniref:cilia- and flagella-associated protein 157-like n=1 Tax=Trachinotus anak TaxID=443729 RepID=UPI0039F1DC5C